MPAWEQQIYDFFNKLFGEEPNCDINALMFGILGGSLILTYIIFGIFDWISRKNKQKKEKLQHVNKHINEEYHRK